MNEIEITNLKADSFAPILLMFFCEIGGYRCSKKASALIEKNGFCEVITTKINDEIVWVTYDEFKSNKLIEVETETRTDIENKLITRK